MNRILGVRPLCLLLALGLILLRVSEAQPALEGVVLNVGARQLTIRTVSGRKTAVVVGQSARLTRNSGPGSRLSDFQKGDYIRATGTGSPFLASLVEEVQVAGGAGVFGRVTAVDPGGRILRVNDGSSPKNFHIMPGTTVFKENRPTNWLDLHQGQSVAIHADKDAALVIFDPPSFVIRHYEPEYGPLLAWGEIERVEEAPQGTSGTLQVRGLTGERVSVDYNSKTRWRLGARFKSPDDFRGVESLVFGDLRTANAVVSLRAIPYLFDTLVSP